MSSLLHKIRYDVELSHTPGPRSRFQGPPSPKSPLQLTNPREDMSQLSSELPRPRAAGAPRGWCCLLVAACCRLTSPPRFPGLVFLLNNQNPAVKSSPLQRGSDTRPLPYSEQVPGSCAVCNMHNHSQRPCLLPPIHFPNQTLISAPSFTEGASPGLTLGRLTGLVSALCSGSSIRDSDSRNIWE